MKTGYQKRVKTFTTHKLDLRELGAEFERQVKDVFANVTTELKVTSGKNKAKITVTINRMLAFGGEVITAAQLQFNTSDERKRYGFTYEDYGQRFLHKGRLVEIAGWDNSKRKFKLMLKNCNNNEVFNIEPGSEIVQSLREYQRKRALKEEREKQKKELKLEVVKPIFNGLTKTICKCKSKNQTVVVSCSCGKRGSHIHCTTCGGLVKSKRQQK